MRKIHIQLNGSGGMLDVHSFSINDEAGADEGVVLHHELTKAMERWTLAVGDSITIGEAV